MAGPLMCKFLLRFHCYSLAEPKLNSGNINHEFIKAQLLAQVHDIPDHRTGQSVGRGNEVVACLLIACGCKHMCTRLRNRQLLPQVIIHHQNLCTTDLFTAISLRFPWGNTTRDISHQNHDYLSLYVPYN